MLWLSFSEMTCAGLWSRQVNLFGFNMFINPSLEVTSQKTTQRTCICTFIIGAMSYLRMFVRGQNVYFWSFPGRIFINRNTAVSISSENKCSNIIYSLRSLSAFKSDFIIYYYQHVCHLLSAIIRIFSLGLLHYGKSTWASCNQPNVWRFELALTSYTYCLLHSKDHYNPTYNKYNIFIKKHLFTLLKSN